jgi:hypothetical protein
LSLLPLLLVFPAPLLFICFPCFLYDPHHPFPLLSIVYSPRPTYLLLSLYTSFSSFS